MNFWDFCAPIYDVAEKTNGKAYRGMLKAVSDLVPQGATVLECAAGTGSISIACSNKASKILCTDMSMNMLDVAKRKARKKNITNITFSECDIYNLNYADKTFDVVIAAQVLHLLDNPEKAAEELKRVASKIVIVPICLLNNLNRFARMKVSIWKLLGFAPKQSFSAESYKNFLEGIGLAPSSFEVIDGQMPMAIGVIKT